MKRVRPLESLTSRGIDDESARLEFATDVQYYLNLQPRQLPSRYLYDELGSALFEAICRLPWYAITRAESRLLERHGAEILRRAKPSQIVELGAGSGDKLRILLRVGERVRAPLRVDLVDLSAAALGQAARALATFDRLHVSTYHASYEDGLAAASRTFAATERVLVLFLGSNIGNFDPPACEALLLGIRNNLRAGDGLLLGTDLIKAERELQLAYDDPLGVTAAFNRNLLVRINRELDGNFDIDRFAHRALWNHSASRVEMHLVSARVQTIQIAAAGLEFRMGAGEPIWTESSYKYQAGQIEAMLEPSRFRVSSQWVDSSARFALTLAEAV